jgi:hypothetical protein
MTVIMKVTENTMMIFRRMKGATSGQWPVVSRSRAGHGS